MHVLTWREVDFASVAVAGLIAGYVMAFAGLWAGTVPGLVAIDIADIGRRYLASDRAAAWLVGLGSHLANSLLLVLLWAAVIAPNLSWPRVLQGFVWGEVLAVGFHSILIAPASGLGLLGWKTGNARFVLTSLLLHGFWGVLVGAIYVPR